MLGQLSILHTLELIKLINKLFSGKLPGIELDHILKIMNPLIIHIQILAVFKKILLPNETF